MEENRGRRVMATRLNRSRSRENSLNSFQADLSRSQVSQQEPIEYTNQNSNSDVLIDSSFLQDLPRPETGKRLKNNILTMRFKNTQEEQAEQPRRQQTRKPNPLNRSFSDRSFEMPNRDDRSASREATQREYPNNQRRAEPEYSQERKAPALRPNQLEAKNTQFDESFTMPAHPVDQMVHRVSNLGELKSRAATPLRQDIRPERHSVDRRDSVISDIGSVSSFQKPREELNDSVYSGSNSTLT